MYIARAVFLGHRLGGYELQRTFARMPELTGKARMLYEATWGTKTYNRYCDDQHTCHGAIVPPNKVLRDLYEIRKTEPTYHKPHHDVESMFWSLYITSIQLVPISDIPDRVTGAFNDTWYNLCRHRDGDSLLTMKDSRDMILFSLPDEVKMVLHPGLSTSPLPRLLRLLCAQITPEYDLLEGIDKPDHLHEAMRRLLLDCIVEMEDEPDIQFDTEKRRTPYDLRHLKRSFENSEDDNCGHAQKRPRTELVGDASVSSRSSI